MAKSNEDWKYGTAQAKISPEETVRVRYKSGTPIEGGMIARSEPVDLFSSARKVSEAKNSDDSGRVSSSIQQQPHHNDGENGKDSDCSGASATAPAAG